MANANISTITVTNTFDQWRVVTGVDLVNERNTLRNSDYVKDNGALILSNGAIVLDNGSAVISNGSITVANSVKGNVTVGRDASVANTIFAGNLIVAAQTSLNNVYITGTIAGPGFQGAGGTGPQGAQGAQGYQGVPGVGVQGAQGFQGEPGGAQGPGTQGPQGFQGVQGAQGFQGEPGGAQGPGAPGAQGPQGFQGVQGAQGFQGVQGAQGFQGVQGAPGTSGSITDDTTSGSTHYPLLSTATSGVLSGVTVSSTKFSFLPSTGVVTATDFASTSDARLKDVHRVIESPIDKIDSLRGVEYTWNETAKNLGVSDDTSVQVGVLAHEVEGLYKSLVQNHEDGYMRVNYDKLVPILIEAIKELNVRLKVLEGK